MPKLNTIVGRGGGAGGWNMVWWRDSLFPTLAAFEIKFQAGLEELMKEFAAELEQYMKTNAPWEDRTGAARDGLSAEFSEDGSKHIITIFHTVDYGIWLEIRWSGAYAIILPTLERKGPELMARLKAGMAAASIVGVG